MTAAKNRDLVVFGEDWGALPTSTQHLIRHISQSWRVLWVNSIGLRRPRLNMRDMSRLARKAAALAAPRAAAPAEPTASRIPTPENVHVVAPLVLPLPGLGPQLKANAALLGWRLKRKMAEFGMENPVLWTSLPTGLAAVGQLGERAVVYYCCDDFGALEGVDHAPVLAMERELAKKSDLVFVSNERLAERFEPSRTRYLPHGADVDLFSRPAPRPSDLPEDGPVAGFYGSFADWLDKDMLRAAAQALPDWRFVFIGDVKTDASMLSDLANVRFLGPRPHAALPGYAQHWTASMIPFRPIPQIMASNPLKLREYLAAGAPIVATPFPALEPYRAHMHLAETPDEFIAGLRGAAAEADNAQRRAARSASVAGETWARRADDARAALERL